MIVIRRGVGEAILLEIPGHGEVIVTIGRIVGQKKADVKIEAPETVSIYCGEFWAGSNGVDEGNRDTL
jgi:sRNA-binding carbon storage regulator CsrA